MATAVKKLRAVAPDEKPERRVVKTLSQAAEDGDYLEILIAQRREMIRDVRDEKGPAKAALHRQIALHSKEIAALQAAADQEAAENGDEAEDEAYDSSAV